MEEFDITNHNEPPKTTREIGIHLVYMSKNMAEINNKLTCMSNSFATKEELLSAIADRRREQGVICKDIESTVKRITKVENLMNGISKRIVSAAITILVMMILAAFGLEKYFK